MDLQISLILLLSFSLAATIKGENTEEEGTFSKERPGRNVQQMVQSDVRKWCKVMVSKWCKVTVSKWYLRCYTVVQSLEDPLDLL